MDNKNSQSNLQHEVIKDLHIILDSICTEIQREFSDLDKEWKLSKNQMINFNWNKIS
jgi:hypothetical protein